jgi:hypothetical protein
MLHMLPVFQKWARSRMQADQTSLCVVWHSLQRSRRLYLSMAMNRWAVFLSQVRLLNAMELQVLSERELDILLECELELEAHWDDLKENTQHENRRVESPACEGLVDAACVDPGVLQDAALNETSGA